MTEKGCFPYHFGQDEECAEEQEGSAEDCVDAEQTKTSGIRGWPAAAGDLELFVQLSSSTYGSFQMNTAAAVRQIKADQTVKATAVAGFKDPQPVNTLAKKALKNFKFALLVWSFRMSKSQHVHLRNLLQILAKKLYQTQG